MSNVVYYTKKFSSYMTVSSSEMYSTFCQLNSSRLS